METSIIDSLRNFLADTVAITSAAICLYFLRQMRAKLLRNEKRFANLEKEIGGFSEKK